MIQQTRLSEVPRAQAGEEPGEIRAAWYQNVRWLQLGLVLLVLAVYGRVVGFEFLNFDDTEYVVLNPRVRGGLTWENVVWALTTDHFCSWMPLTWLSLVIDRQLFENFAGGYHLTNVLWHAANTVLVFRLLCMTTGSAGRSAMVAALFGLHPLHVESVAWISSRKDVLSTFFGLLALIWYVRYAWDGGRRWMVAAWGALVCGLLSKQMLVTWPCVLVLLDVWPLGRWNGRLWGSTRDPSLPSTAEMIGGRSVVQVSLLRLLAEKWAWFAAAIVCSAVVYLVQQSQGAVDNLKHLPLSIRLGNAVLSYAAYLQKTVWPVHLAPHYPHPGTNLSWGMVALAGAGLLAFSALAVRLYRRAPYVLIGWLWYLGTLVPVIGIIQVGTQAYADRYTYIPLMGIFLLAVWGTVDVSERLRLSERWLTSAAGIVLAACLVLSWRQVGSWRNSRILWKHALQVVDNSDVAHFNYGITLYKNKEIGPAIEHFRKARQLQPEAVDPRYYLGLALMVAGQEAESRELLEDLERELAGKPKFQEYRETLLQVLGLYYAEHQEPRRAEQYLLRAVDIRDTSSKTHRLLGQIYLSERRWEQAERAFWRAVELDPTDHLSHNLRGEVLLQQGRRAEAVAAFRQSLAVRPGYEIAEKNLQRALKE